jgi:hypothetical protein
MCSAGWSAEPPAQKSLAFCACTGSAAACNRRGSIPYTKQRKARAELVRRSGRYFISSLLGLTAEHWLLVIRRHWAVETAHQILDTAFADNHPWIEANPRAALVVALLRRISYTILTLFRSVTQRSDERRAVPWKGLIEDVFFALLTTTNQQLAALPMHRPIPLC